MDLADGTVTVRLREGGGGYGGRSRPGYGLGDRRYGSGASLSRWFGYVRQEIRGWLCRHVKNFTCIIESDLRRRGSVICYSNVTHSIEKNTK